MKISICALIDPEMTVWKSEAKRPNCINIQGELQSFRHRFSDYDNVKSNHTHKNMSTCAAVWVESSLILGISWLPHVTKSTTYQSITIGKVSRALLILAIES